MSEGVEAKLIRALGAYVAASARARAAARRRVSSSSASSRQSSSMRSRPSEASLRRRSWRSRQVGLGSVALRFGGIVVAFWLMGRIVEVLREVRTLGHAATLPSVLIFDRPDGMS